MVNYLPLAMLAGAYLLGSVPFGLLIGKCYGVDIRKVGSCNIGATNVTRTVGKWQGKLCFFLDFLKGALPTAASVFFVYPENPWMALGMGGFAILGHMFPLYLKFKGGKGISTAAGAALVLAPYPLIMALISWIVVFKISRFVSLASIFASAMLPVLALFCGRLGVGNAISLSWQIQLFFIIIGIVAVARDHANIKRLLEGTEYRFEKKKPEEDK
jgi:glycerol-3-phosphate acyltransferase PlsY